MIITINVYNSKDTFMNTTCYEFKGITKGLINVNGKPCSMIKREQSQGLDKSKTVRLLVSCKTIESGILMLKSELANNFHSRQLINELEQLQVK